ncbi:MAG: tetratricopeptide repeat protein [Saprospiraceae bacterium]|nr:tetratricopeptide repeat protein [Saprospiraceae bacterium]
MDTLKNESHVSAGKALLENRKYDEAITYFKQQVDKHPLGEVYAGLGRAYFMKEQYDMAANAYETALKLDASNEEWRELWHIANSNALSEVQVPVPDIYHFEKEKLLAVPLVPAGTLPKPLPAPPGHSVLTRIRLAIGNASGAFFSFLMESLSGMVGTIMGYRDKIWTNWYRRNYVLSILTLAYMREKLNSHNLLSSYPKDALIGFQPEGQTPPEGVTHFRTADGSWNNLTNPKEGAAGTRFPRNSHNDAIRPETSEQLLSPNPREISRKLLTRGEKMKEVPFLNMLAAVWIQFQNHDWINHGENVLNELYEIPLAEDDPARKKYWLDKMFVPKTQPDPTYIKGKDETPVTFINEVTHWWDGSQIYGSDQETVNRLRSGKDGKMKLNDDFTLPTDKKGIEETGFVRNWWVGLAMLHTLFTREHNAICDMLKSNHPDWDDNRLFNVARLINAAITAKIHSVEWTPAILPNKVLESALNANWYGMLTNLFKSGNNRKTVAEINVRNPELGGVVGNPINKHGAPYGLTEEFTEVYRLHSLLPETLKIRTLANKDQVEEVPFPDTRQAGSRKLTKRVAMADLFYSFGNQAPGALELNNFPKFMQELSIPFFAVYDMGAVDIIRARERGVPRYNEFRRQLGLTPINTFDDLTDDKEVVRKIKEVYGDKPEDVEKLDLLVGTLSEKYRPTNFGFGETMFQIFILNATRRLQSDRFYTDCYTAEYYTQEGLEWIDKTDFKTVILRHFPELEKTGLGNIKNAFEPWDTEETLDPGRHPLRAYDKSLKPNPWKGDAY